MNRGILLLIVLSILAGMAIPSGALAAGNTFPFPNQQWGLNDGIGTIGELFFQLFQGWFDGKLVWHIISVGQNPQTLNADLDPRFRYPKLTSAIGNGAALMYIVQNFQQGPVFTAVPGNTDYSGLWQVVYIRWKPGAVRRPICSASELPSPAEADFITTNIVVDRPILAVGPLSNPWFPAPPGSYRLQQVGQFFPDTRGVIMTGWEVYGQDPVTKAPLIGAVIIPDVADPTLAAILHANYAPALASVDPANTQKFWVQDWTLPPPPPPTQLPIVERSDYIFTLLRNPNRVVFPHNFDYTPVMDLTLLRRLGPPSFIVNNPTTLQRMLPPFGNCFEMEGSPVRINALMTFSESITLTQR